MNSKGEAKYLERWIRKSRALDKEPPRPSVAGYNLDHTDDAGLEQVNLKLPRGSKKRLQELGRREGLSMRRMFKRLLDEFEERYPGKRKG